MRNHHGDPEELVIIQETTATATMVEIKDGLAERHEAWEEVEAQEVVAATTGATEGRTTSTATGAGVKEAGRGKRAVRKSNTKERGKEKKKSKGTFP